MTPLPLPDPSPRSATARLRRHRRTRSVCMVVAWTAVGIAVAALVAQWRSPDWENPARWTTWIAVAVILSALGVLQLSIRSIRDVPRPQVIAVVVPEPELAEPIPSIHPDRFYDLAPGDVPIDWRKVSDGVWTGRRPHE